MNNNLSEIVNPGDGFNPKAEFAAILSEAISANPALRAYLKEEALRRFDKDYDVFHPLTKNVIVEPGRSFRQALKEYDSNNNLERIEAELPLLNILVPDWSWIDGFSVTVWDVRNNDVSVAYVNNNNGHLTIHTTGESDFELANGRFLYSRFFFLKKVLTRQADIG